MPTVELLFCDEAPNFRLNSIHWEHPVLWEQLVTAAGCLGLLHMQLVWCIGNDKGVQER